MTTPTWDQIAFGQKPTDADLAEIQKSQGRFMTRTAKGWERMWGEIAKKYGDAACRNETEEWQYMDSFSMDGGVTWTHELRHRALPPRGERTYERVPALADDFDEQPASLTIPT